MCVLLVIFFFQAEDGIRDLVRSRGLGDVYKRQLMEFTIAGVTTNAKFLSKILTHRRFKEGNYDINSVSYTHLTLPTSDLV